MVQGLLYSTPVHFLSFTANVEKKTTNFEIGFHRQNLSEIETKLAVFVFLTVFPADIFSKYNMVIRQICVLVSSVRCEKHADG